MVYDSVRKLVVMLQTRGPNEPDVMHTWIWNGDWQEVITPTSPPPRASFRMAFDARRGVTVMYGGRDPITTDEKGDLWEFDGTMWTPRTFAAPAPSERADHAMAFDPNTQSVMLGGGTDLTGDRRDVWLWNGTAWTQVADAPAFNIQFGTDPLHGWVVMVDSHLGTGTWWTWNGTSLTAHPAPDPLTVGPPSKRHNVAAA